MLDRRSFLRSSLAGSFGLLASEFDVSFGSMVHPHGFHPISPERVAIFKGSAEPKTRWIDRLAKVLADHYAIPATSWADGMARREALGSTSLGQGFGLLHQFQHGQAVRLDREPVDWWLFIFQGGIEWESFDDNPVFAMIGHIFANDSQPSLRLRTYELTTRLCWKVMSDDDWSEIARPNRRDAARTVNAAIARCLAERR